MKSIDAPVQKTSSGFVINCVNCNAEKIYSTKHTAIKALARKTCFECQTRRHSFSNENVKIYRNSEKKWCSACPDCGVEQAYTRMDHAKTSQTKGWRCRSCCAQSKGFSNKSTGFYENIRLGWYRRFELSAQQRNLNWDLTIENLEALWQKQNGKCALSGINLDNAYLTETVSIDRIDSKNGYSIDNVQLVHKDLNLMKRSMSDEVFISWCCLIAKHKGGL
jgi:hypothetical protein